MVYIIVREIKKANLHDKFTLYIFKNALIV